MFSNCYKYNPPDHDVVAMARKLQVSIASHIVSGKPCVTLFNQKYMDTPLSLTERKSLLPDPQIHSFHSTHNLQWQSENIVFLDIFANVSLIHGIYKIKYWSYIIYTGAW